MLEEIPPEKFRQLVRGQNPDLGEEELDRLTVRHLELGRLVVRLWAKKPREGQISHSPESLAQERGIEHPEDNHPP